MTPNCSVLDLFLQRYVFSPRYGVDLGGHVFPTQKYGRIADRLAAEDGVAAGQFVEPDPAEGATITAVHTERYFTSCRDDLLSPLEIAQLELPWSDALFDSAARAVEGSCLATRFAMAEGVGLHIGGGFHHAFPDHGEGFCVFNDVACAARVAMASGVERVLVADCDLHHGNGTAAIFAEDPAVATFSIHEEGIYPVVKPPSTLDVGLDAGTADDVYLDRLGASLPGLARQHDPQLIYYVAGADPFVEDQLGNLRLTKSGLRERDRIVIETARELAVPLVVVLAGGYARDPEDTADIHLTTFREARQLAG